MLFNVRLQFQPSDGLIVLQRVLQCQHRPTQGTRHASINPRLLVSVAMILAICIGIIIGLGVK